MPIATPCPDRTYRGAGHIERRRVSLRYLPAALLVIALGAAGCSSANRPSATPPSHHLTTHAPVPTPKAASSSTASDSGTTGNVTPIDPYYNGYQAVPNANLYGVTADGSGDKVRVAIGIGRPEPLTDLSGSEMTTCGPGVSPWQFEPTRSVAIPLTIEAAATTQFPLLFGVTFDLNQIVTSGGNLVNLPNTTYWAQQNGTTGDCSQGEGGVVFNTLTPNVNTVWKGWEIIAEAISPNDPTGTRIANRAVAPWPTFLMGSANGVFRVKPSHGSTVVQCSSLMPPHALALSVQSAQAGGCTRG